MSPESSGDNLAQLQTVVMRHHSLETLHEVPGDACVISAGFVRIDHAHTRPLERELVEGCLVRFETREPAHVVDEDDIRDAATGVGANIQEGEKPTTTRSVQATSVVAEFLHDLVSLLSCPAAHLLSLFLNGEVLVCPRAAEESIGWDHVGSPVTLTDRTF